MTVCIADVSRWPTFRTGRTAQTAVLVVSRLGAFQFGFLHFGHTLGKLNLLPLGTHSWSHRGKELAKIECGKVHFATLEAGESPAKYRVVHTSDDLFR